MADTVLVQVGTALVVVDIAQDIGQGPGGNPVEADIDVAHPAFRVVVAHPEVVGGSTHPEGHPAHLAVVVGVLVVEAGARRNCSLSGDPPFRGRQVGADHGLVGDLVVPVSSVKMLNNEERDSKSN